MLGVHGRQARNASNFHPEDDSLFFSEATEIGLKVMVDKIAEFPI